MSSRLSLSGPGSSPYRLEHGQPCAVLGELVLVFAVDIALDMDLFAAELLLLLRGRREMAGAVLFVDPDLLLELDVAVLVDGDGCGEGFVKLFVTFPSDVRNLRR
jgi:hypothetical protein